MIRWLLLLLGGVLLGGIVHLATIFVLPRTATQDAYSRLTPIAPVNRVIALPAPTVDKAVMPFMDPAFAEATCRYDLTDGPLKLTVPVSTAYTSISFYTRNDIAYYAINDRAAGRRAIELDLMTVEQHNEMPEEEDVTAADRLIVESPTVTGLVAIRALAPEPGLMPIAQSVVGAATCVPADRSKPSN
jgi:Predicted integral membrane protein